MNSYNLEPIINAIAELKGSIARLRQMEDDRVPLSDILTECMERGGQGVNYVSLKSAMGFIIVRHVDSKLTDYYWKECYTCIRTWYDNPIIIIDDSSDFEFLHDNLKLVNCHIIYDTEWKGCGELLGYYYYHLLKPFETAVILQDSVFIQKWIDFSLKGANMQFLWTSSNHVHDALDDLCKEILACYQQGISCFGLMSVIKWDFLDLLVEDGLLFALGKIKGRKDMRSVMESILGFMAFRRDPTINAKWGEIHLYTQWVITFLEYLYGSVNNKLDIVKVWTGR